MKTERKTQNENGRLNMLPIHFAHFSQPLQIELHMLSQQLPIFSQQPSHYFEK